MRMIQVAEPNPKADERAADRLLAPYSTVEMMKAACGKRCPYCSMIMTRGTYHFPTRDHIRPRSAGGKLTPDNCVIVCGPCNVAKGSKSLERFAAALEHKKDSRAPIVRAFIESLRRGGRAVEGTGPENRQTETSRGFESTPSPPLVSPDGFG